MLLSLRFLSLVFEEVRNLSLGLASRGVDWVALGTGGSLALVGRLSMRLFGNLFHRLEEGMECTKAGAWSKGRRIGWRWVLGPDCCLSMLLLGNVSSR